MWSVGARDRLRHTAYGVGVRRPVDPGDWWEFSVSVAQAMDDGYTEYVARAYDDEYVAEKFTGLRGWYGGGWGIIDADMKAGTPILVHNDVNIFEVLVLEVSNC